MLSVSSDEYVFITGQSPNGTGASLMTTWRYEPNGSLSMGWPVMYGSSATVNYGMCVIADSAGGGCTVAGAVAVSGQGSDIVVIKYESDGDIVSGFPVTYNNSAQDGDDYPVDMDFDADGGIWVGGVSDGDGTSTDYVLVGWSATGSFFDSDRFEGGYEDVLVDLDAYAIVSSPTSQTIGISVTGTSYTSPSTWEDIVTIHYTFVSSALSVAGTATYIGSGGQAKQFATGLAAPGNSTADVDVFVCGYSNDLLDSQNVALNYVVLGYQSRSTTPDWTDIFNGAGSGDDIARRIDAQPIPGGGMGVYVTGTSYGGATDGNNVVTLAFDRNGTLLWDHEIDGATNDQVVDLVAVFGGDVYLMTKRHNGTNYDYRTVKINADTGLDGWLTPPIYNAPPFGGFDEPLAVRYILDPNDGTDPERTPFVYASGRSLGSLDSTMKYATVTYSQ